MTFFSDFRYGLRSSQSTADLLTAVSDRTDRVFNKSGATRAVARDITKAFNRVWHDCLLQELNSHGIPDQIFALFRLFSVIGSSEWFWKGSLCKDIQLILEFVKAPFLALQFSYYTSTTFYDTALYLDVIRHLICGNKENWLLNLNLIHKTLWTKAGSGCWFCWFSKHICKLTNFVI